MALQQDFRFEYGSTGQVTLLLREVAESYALEVRNDRFFIIRGVDFVFDASIEPFGLRSDRSGNYFEFVGLLVERLTGKFGALQVKDV